MSGLYEGLGLVDSARTRRSKRRPTSRHPAEVTADRLGEAYEKWYDKFDGAELDMISQLKHVFDQIASGER